jgi:5'-nucleotidase
MRILLTNDDGIQAPGLRALYQALTQAGHEVRVVAPVAEMSAVGHAITFTTPLRTKAFQEERFTGTGVYGTPADCVKLGVTALLDQAPDLVVSGINAGANVGVDIVYSGTVSAATEGALMGLPALAVSYDDFNPTDLSGQAAYVADFIPRIGWTELPAKCLINLNFPKVPMAEVKGLRVCPHTRASYRDWYDVREDPRGRAYYWLNGVIERDMVSPDRDRSLLWEGYITVTPLRFDFNDPATQDLLRKRLEP